MTFTQIGYFLQVARTLNITEAAAQIHVTQPTLSRQISAMEEELNMPLFVRGRKRLNLTPAGAVLRDELTGLMEQYQQSIEKAERASWGISGTLRIGVLDGHNISTTLPAAVDYLEKNYPNIKLYLQRASFGELMDLLYEKKLDAIISYEFHIRDQSDLESIPLETVRPALAIPLRHPLAARDAITVADLKGETLVIVSETESPGGVQLIRDTCRQVGGFLPQFHFVDTMEDATLWVEAGVRCALFNTGMSIVHDPQIKVVEVAELPSLSVLLSWYRHNENEALPLLTNFFRHMTDQ